MRTAIATVCLSGTLTEKVDPGFSFYQSMTSIYPADEAAKDSFQTKPIGLGPFKFVEHVKGSHWRGERFERYYATDRPYLDGFRGVLLTQPAAMLNALQGGQIQAEFPGGPMPALVVVEADDVTAPAVQAGIKDLTATAST